jgi:hypothetical protein
VIVRKEHGHRAIQHNLKYEITKTKQRGSWYRMELKPTPGLPNSGQKFRHYFVVFQNVYLLIYLFIPLFLAKLRPMFCRAAAIQERVTAVL